MSLAFEKYDMKNLIITTSDRSLRLTWTIVYYLFFRLTPVCFHPFRRLILNVFGANLSVGVKVYPTVSIWAPWNLSMGEFSTLGPYVDCYSVDKIDIGPRVTVSQRSFLCTASHDYNYPETFSRAEMPLIGAPIKIGEAVWIAAESFIGPGVNIEENGVVLARSVVVKDVARGLVVAGNPSKVVKARLENANRPKSEWTPVS